MPIKRYGAKWRIISAILFLALIGSYFWYVSEHEFTHGGSPAGLVYGFVALFLMLLLVFFGVRKRWYRSNWGKLEDWLQSHIYLGLLSLFVVLAHTGFRFQDKVAVVLFIVIALVIVTGAFGAVLYKVIPRELTEVQSNLTAQELSDQLNQMAKTMARLASGKSSPFQRIYQGLMKESIPGALAGWRLIFSNPRRAQEKAGEWAGLVGLVEKNEQDELRQLLVVSRQHKELHTRLKFQQRYRNMLDFWLYMHLPLSIGMLVLIVAHLYGVFYYGIVQF